MRRERRLPACIGDRRLLACKADGTSATHNADVDVRAPYVSPAEFLGNYPENLRDIAGDLRDLVRSTFPSVIEKVAKGWKVITYRLLAGKKSIYFCCIAPQKKENDVLLGFEYGIAMRDPKNLLEGKGTQVRFVRLRHKDQYVEADLTWLIKEAAKVALEFRTGQSLEAV